MNVKIVVENVGPDHARMELEETCGLGALKNLFDEVADVLVEFAESPSTVGNPCAVTSASTSAGA